MWEDNKGLILLEEVLLWIMDSYFIQKQWFKVKTPYWQINFFI